MRVLSGELRQQLIGCGVDKAYQIGRKEIVLKLFGRGSHEFVAAPNFICLTKYKRPAPKDPSSFVMQLRKHLSGKVIRDFSQHGFDRIVEFHFDEHILVFELFSRGNVLLLGRDMKILGLLEWQRWKDRMLGVGKTYEYPPLGIDPFEIGAQRFREVMASSERGVAASLATRMGLGGSYAESVCAGAGIDTKASYADVDGGVLWSAFRAFLERVGGGVDARISDGNVTPFGGEGEQYPSFNEAVDEYFSRLEDTQASDVQDTKTEDRRIKIAEVLRKQEDAYGRAKVEARDEKIRGDLIYQRMGELNAVIAYVRDARKSGLSDGEILKGLQPYGIVKGLKGYSLSLDI
ncbi:MAG: NFACT family protein [Candidatus Altiarchaeota archaeon]